MSMSPLSGSPQASPILVLGAVGQVGRALVALLQSRCVAWDKDELDLTDLRAVEAALDRLKPSAVINAAAYTAVDLAEKEEDVAILLNGAMPGVLARWCARNGAPLVHYSTDYVFPGTGTRPWVEEDATGPLSAYGRSKLEGERQIVAAGGSHLIFRTSWVFDETGKNFVRTMLKLGRERETLSVVCDQVGAPTYAPDLAAATLVALDRARTAREFPSGIYHLCNGGETHWKEFACSIFAIAREKGWPVKVQEIRAITTAEYAVPARRPLNSRMSTERAWSVFGVRMPDWRTGLVKCMGRLVWDEV